jgi:hypothetical protein
VLAVPGTVVGAGPGVACGVVCESWDAVGMTVFPLAAEVVAIWLLWLFDPVDNIPMATNAVSRPSAPVSANRTRGRIARCWVIMLISWRSSCGAEC